MSERERRPGGTEEIIRKIGETAASYTPEWDFNPEDPDIGSALALAYADMLGETARQMDWLGYKNQLALFGSLGAERKPAVPARGYAVFSVMEGAPGGTEVDAHTSMTADLEGEEGGNAQYETLEDLYAVPAEPSCLYLADGRQDAIYCVSENIMEEQASLLLFREKGENLQRHELVLTHGELLDIRNEAYLELGLYAREGQPAEKKFLEALADPAAPVFLLDGRRLEALRWRLSDRRQAAAAQKYLFAWVFQDRAGGARDVRAALRGPGRFQNKRAFCGGNPAAGPGRKTCPPDRVRSGKPVRFEGILPLWGKAEPV